MISLRESALMDYLSYNYIYQTILIYYKKGNIFNYV